ncbi:AAA family ATPase [Arthrobacter zhaoxinii]|uniref:AAA family ATPase n=1 Tax=Arthrobacter zhaoxinii TaxID=2964616 RepID=UPI002105D21E|nr:AAA family ATPase [Arthrobacter zhaoxinii]MCQ2001319.1 AAA family ATPase [Arthrobacter zhaoxinii]
MPFINDRLNEIKQQQDLQKMLQEDRSRPIEPINPSGPPESLPAVDDGADLEAIRRRLRHRIVGQNQAIEAVVRSVAIGQAGLNDRDRPLANILLLGPTGVGKTELVRQVAGILRSDPDDLSRIDMSSLSQEHYMASLTGAPPGYAGAKESFSLFDRSKISGDPYTPGIALFDEVEKAHRSVHRAMLHVLDNGLLKLANGQETINFRNSYVFMTSNLGSAELLARSRSRVRGILDKTARGIGVAESTVYRRFSLANEGMVVRKALEGFFEPEFINRIDEIVVFNSLTGRDAVGVVRLEISDLARRCALRGINLAVDPAVAVFIAGQGFDQTYGARSIKLLVRDQLATPVARAALGLRGATGESVQLLAEVGDGAVAVIPVES